MGSDIWIWKYELTSASPLNKSSNRTKHQGALLRVNSGVGCLHPWPELGDFPLDQQISDLASGNPTPQTKISLSCAEIDRIARENNESLFRKPIPKSHWTYRTGDDIEKIKAEGFDTLKAKIGPQKVDIPYDSGLKLRLDANYTFQLGEFIELWETLPQDRIEFIEDPVPWNQKNWERLEKEGVPIALDRDAGIVRTQYPHTIIKPAILNQSDIGRILSERRSQIVVTSYMDHPIGQMWAAWCASEIEQPVSQCGLITHHCFEPSEFSEAISTNGPELLPTEGTGLGFDDILQKLPWKKLT